MRDFVETILEAQSKYESRPNSKAYTWLEKLSGRIAYYGGTLDVVVQHHPEYVSLAWGAFKFLFHAVLNHEELVKNLAKACSRIAESLPRSDLSLILYPTTAMREAVARLYAALMKFLLRALRWYRHGRLIHVLSSVANPWGIEFEQELGDVERQARAVDELAQSASRAELREAHFQIHEIRYELQAVTKIVEDGFQRMTQLALGESAASTLLIFDPADVWGKENQSLQSRMSNDLTASKEMIYRVQLGQILSISFLESLPTSGQCLAYCNSFRFRRQNIEQQRQIPDASALQKWNDQQSLTLVVTEDSSRIHASDLMVDIISLIRRQGLPVLWALRSSDLQSSPLTLLDVIRMLLYQALQVNPAALSQTHPITVAHLREASTHEDWLLLFQRALQGLPAIFIVFDPGLVDHVTGRDKSLATKFFVDLAKFLGPERAKLIVSSFNFDTRYTEQSLGLNMTTALKTQAWRSTQPRLKRLKSRTARRRRR
ncbi:hypothetical protein F5Y14DRAFT_287331 [Nemania sp. NC0429]|nr:hypothetical protein F5Y14DRAFT_287331 [Nemania sp. NC0429]